MFKYQFGFRKNYSTSLALIDVTELIYNCLENNKLVLRVFIDLQKAFDTVDHGILLRKLYHYGIREQMYQWFESYLFGRLQFTLDNNEESKMSQIKCGLQQGSALGPLLFLLYVNDIGAISPDFYIRLFADDSNLFMSHDNLSSLFEATNSMLGHLND